MKNLSESVCVIFVVMFLLNITGAFASSGKSGECFGNNATEAFSIGRNIQSYIGNTEDRCFKLMDRKYMENLITKSTFASMESLNEMLGNITRDFCPSWPASKACLSDHFRAACDSEEIKAVRGFPFFNYEMVIAELVCRPLLKVQLTTVLLMGTRHNLWECFSESRFGQTYGFCMYEAFGQVENLETSKTFSEVFDQVHECVKQGVEKCAEGDMIQGILWGALLDSINRVYRGAYISLWARLV